MKCCSADKTSSVKKASAKTKHIPARRVVSAKTVSAAARK
jgi:hypothetical protein